MRLAELTWPDKLLSRDYRKVSMRHSVEFLENAVSFWLPGNKADHFFEGNRLIIHAGPEPNSYSHFRRYLASRDTCFRARPELWLRADGTIPPRSWFIKRLHRFLRNQSQDSPCVQEVLLLLLSVALPPTSSRQRVDGLPIRSTAMCGKVPSFLKLS
jgi:hypothetical protein